MNILRTIQDQFSPELLGQISRSVGETPEATQHALEHSLPALLGSAAAKASSPEGATGLFDMLKEKAPQGGWAASSLSSLLGKGGGVGSSLVSSLLGSKSNMIRDFIASRSGIRSESASTLLGTGGSLLMGVLGRQIATQGLGASGFGQLLRSQIPHLQGLLPPELASMLGIGNLLSSAGPAPAATAPPTYYGTQVQATQPREVVGTGAPSASRVLRWALLPLALLAGLLFMVHRYNRQTSVGGTSDETVTTRGADTSIVATNLDALRTHAATLTDRLKTALAQGDGSPIELQGVNFDPSGTLSTTANGTLTSLGRMISDNPTLKVTITAYGKTAEDAATRANAIKSALVTAGGSSDSISVRPEVGDGYPKVSFTK